MIPKFLTFILILYIHVASSDKLDKTFQQLLQKAIQQRSLRSAPVRTPLPVSKRSATIPVFRQKLDEIARAYAEGYKAALLAVQARSNIQRPSTASSNGKARAATRSFIPKNLPEMTVNAIEKSGIPRPSKPVQRSLIPKVRSDINIHNMVQRSAPILAPFARQHFAIESGLTEPLTNQQYVKRSNVYHPGKENGIEQHGTKEEKRVGIAKLNYAARHRNVFLDSVGGDPYSGSSGVLSRQHFWLNKHRRDAGEEKPRKVRKRRSHEPYLGQNLDKLGIIRAIFNYNESPRKNKKVGEEFNYAPMEPVVNIVPAKQQPFQPRYVSKKSLIPHPYVQLGERFLPYSYNGNQGLPVTSRSYIPNNIQRLAKENQRLINEYQTLQRNEDDERIKREHISRLNYAARHRNVYLDRMGGDPYGGSSGVLTRQHIMFRKHKRSSEEEPTTGEEETNRDTKKPRSEKGIK